MAEDDWEALAESSEALDKVVASNPNLQKHADEDKAQEAPEAPKPQAKPKQPKKVIGEDFDKKQKAKAKPADTAAPLDPVSEKLRRQKMEEDADHLIADELFEDVPKVTLSSEDSYKQYAQQVSAHLSAGLPHRVPIFLKEVLRMTATALTSTHLIDVSQTLTALITEKQKQEKGTAGTKKKTNQKPSLQGVGKKASTQDFGFEDEVPEEEDEYGDFM